MALSRNSQFYSFFLMCHMKNSLSYSIIHTVAIAAADSSLFSAICRHVQDKFEQKKEVSFEKNLKHTDKKNNNLYLHHLLTRIYLIM